MRTVIERHTINTKGYYDFTEYVTFPQGVSSNSFPIKVNDLVTKRYVDVSLSNKYKKDDKVRDTVSLGNKPSSYYTDIPMLLDYAPLNMSTKGVAGGYVSLDNNAKIYNSEINGLRYFTLSYDSISDFPTIGISGVIYIDKTTNYIYRWNGLKYIALSGSSGSYDSIWKLKIPRLINGAAFDGTSDIVTQLWGNSRLLKVGDKSTQVNGTNSVNYSISDVFGYDPLGGNSVNMDGQLLVNTYADDNLSIVNKSYVDGLLSKETSSRIPVGSMIPYDSTAVTPPGFLKCNGASVSKTIYHNLYSVIGDYYGNLSAPGNGKSWKQQYNINSQQSFDLTNWNGYTSLPAPISNFMSVVTNGFIYLVGGEAETNISDLPKDSSGKSTLLLNSSGGLTLPAGITNVTITGKGGDGEVVTTTAPEQPYVPQIGLPDYPNGLPPYRPAKWVTEVINSSDSSSVTSSFYWKVCGNKGAPINPYDYFNIDSGSIYDQKKSTIENSPPIDMPVLCTNKYTMSDGNKYIVLETYLYKQGNSNFIDGLPVYRAAITYSPPVTTTKTVNGDNSTITIGGQTYTFNGGIGVPATPTNYIPNTDPSNQLVLNYTVAVGGYISLSFNSQGGTFSSTVNYLLSSEINNGSISTWTKNNEVNYNLSGTGSITLPAGITNITLTMKGTDGKTTTTVVGGNGYIPPIGDPNYPNGLPHYMPPRIVLNLEVVPTYFPLNVSLTEMSSSSFHDFIVYGSNNSSSSDQVYYFDKLINSSSNTITYTEYIKKASAGLIQYYDGLPPYKPGYYFQGKKGDLLPGQGNSLYPNGLPGYIPSEYLCGYSTYPVGDSGIPSAISVQYTDGPGITSNITSFNTPFYINKTVDSNGNIGCDYVEKTLPQGSPNFPYGLPPYKASGDPYVPGTPVNNITVGLDSVVTVNNNNYTANGGNGVPAVSQTFNIQLPGNTATTISYNIPTEGSCSVVGINYLATIPTSISKSQVLTINNKMYIIGGWDGYKGSNCLYVTNINQDGSISGWTTLPVLPFTVYNSNSIVTTNKIYILGGIINDSISDSIYSCTINPDGTLSNWGLTGNLPKPVASSNSFVTKNKVYILGAPGSYEIHKAKLKTDGTIDTWSTDYFPFYSSDSKVFVTTKCVYILGGKYDNKIYNKVFIVPILDNGDLGSGYYGSDLPIPLSNFDIAATSNKLYIIGGSTTSGDTPLVYYSGIIGSSDNYSQYYSPNNLQSGNINYFSLPNKSPYIDSYIGFIIKT